MSPYSMPLCTIFTKCPAPCAPQCSQPCSALLAAPAAVVLARTAGAAPAAGARASPRAGGAQRLDGVGAAREHDALVARGEQSARHVAAHPADADHPELHDVYLRGGAPLELPSAASVASNNACSSNDTSRIVPFTKKPG